MTATMIDFAERREAKLKAVAYSTAVAAAAYCEGSYPPLSNEEWDAFGSCFGREALLIMISGEKPIHDLVRSRLGLPYRKKEDIPQTAWDWANRQWVKVMRGKGM